MKSPLKTPPAVAIVAEMMASQAQYWSITPERLRLLRSSHRRVPTIYQAAIGRMLEEHSAGSLLWPRHAEYMAALHQISLIYQRPGEDDLRAAIDDVTEGSIADGVAHADWVQRVLAFLERLMRYESVSSQAPEPEDPF